MRIIYKYSIDRSNNNREFTLELPIGAEFLFFSSDPINALCAWFQVDTGREVRKKKYYMAGTGFRLPDNLDNRLMFLQSCLDGPYVWHLYKILE